MRTQDQHVPVGYQSVTTYLAVHNAQTLISFLKDVFGAIETENVPGDSGQHCELMVGDTMIMVGEAPGDRPAMPAMFYVYVADADATYNRAIHAGGTSLKEPGDQIYGDRTAAVQDSFGNQWYVATRKQITAPKETAVR